MYTFYNEDNEHSIYVMNGRQLFKELIQDGIDYDTGIWQPYFNKWYTVNGQLIQVLDEQDTVEKAIQHAKNYNNETYELIDMTKEIEYGQITYSIDVIIEMYWGSHAYASEIELESRPNEDLTIYAIYNDSIDDYVQLGTLTIKELAGMTLLRAYKEISS